MILGHTLTFRRALFPLSLIALTLILTYLGADHNYYRSTLSQKWDDKGVLSWDWTDTKEEVGCRALGRSSGQQTTKSSKTPIPNIVHFVVLSSEGEQYDLSYSSFLAIKAAIVRMNAAEIKVHTYHNGLNIRNPWWLELQGHVTLVEFERPEQGPRGLLMKDLPLAHQSDLARLNILQMEGGIYMDTDMFALKPFTDLLDSPRDIVMGHEGANRYGLSNAVMLARPVSEFLRIWQHTYRTYDPRLWNEHSVRKPKEMQVGASKGGLLVTFAATNEARANTRTSCVRSPLQCSSGRPGMRHIYRTCTMQSVLAR